MQQIGEVAVIGAGVMGSGIAALMANAGVSVTLLDIDPQVAQHSIARQVKSGSLSEDAAGYIRTGSTVSDLGLVTEAGWIIEAAAERLDIKHQIFAAIDQVRRPGSIVSSNTSTIRLSQLVGNVEHDRAGDYLITHFFNPPRTMRLLELVSGPQTRPEATAAVEQLARKRLDRCVVHCRDTPGFIANRIGNYWMAVAVDEAVALKISVEEADAILSGPFGTPMGIFSLLDLVGIDLLPAGWGSLQAALAPEDALQSYPQRPAVIEAMIKRGNIGRKAGAGFFRRESDGEMSVLDLSSMTYRPRRAVKSLSLDTPGSNLRQIMEDDSNGGRFARNVMGRTLAYAASLVPEVTDSPAEVDEAMREGYGWRDGPFALIERIGSDWLSKDQSRLGAGHRIHIGGEDLRTDSAMSGLIRDAN